MKTNLLPLFDLTFLFIIFFFFFAIGWLCCDGEMTWRGNTKWPSSAPMTKAPSKSSHCGQGYDAMKAICLIRIVVLKAAVEPFQGGATLSQTPNMSFKFWLWNQIGQNQNWKPLKGLCTATLRSYPDINLHYTNCLTALILIEIQRLNFIYCCFVHLVWSRLLLQSF